MKTKNLTTTIFALSDYITVTKEAGETRNLPMGDVIAEITTLIAAERGPWAPITINSTVYYLVKAAGNVASTLEINDKVIGDEADQIIAAKYLGGDETDFGNPAVWDKTAIA